MKGRIALFTNTLAGGGMERAVVNIANQLSQNYYQVDLLLAECKGDLFEELSSNVNVVCLRKYSKIDFRLIWPMMTASRYSAKYYLQNLLKNWPKALRCIPDIKMYIRKYKPDILISTPMTASVAAILACERLADKPKLFAREASTLSVETENKNKSSFGNIAKLVPWAYAKTELVLSVSKGVKQDLCDKYSLKESCVEVLRNPIDAKQLINYSSEYNSNELIINLNSCYILGIGRLEEQKDFDTLIRAFSALKFNLPIKLVILGEGSKRKDLEDLVEELGISERVILPGFVRNPYPYLSNCDLFVLSSKWEGLANVLREAMIFGKKIVATDCPSGTREILENYTPGIVVPVSDYIAMSNAIFKALNTSSNEKINSVTSDIDDYLNLVNRFI